MKRDFFEKYLSILSGFLFFIPLSMIPILGCGSVDVCTAFFFLNIFSNLILENAFQQIQFHHSIVAYLW